MGGKLIISEPKTKAAFRTIILPPAMVELLLAYRKGIFSDLMFPSRIKPEQPIDPGYARKRLQIILESAGCKGADSSLSVVKLWSNEKSPPIWR